MNKDLALFERLPHLKKLPILGQEELNDLILRYRNGDREAMTKLIEHNLRLVIREVNKFCNQNPGADLEDAFQNGVIGLIRAIDLFDTERNIRFSTYAVTWIWQSVNRYYRSSILKVPMVTQLAVRQIKAASIKFYEEHHRYPTVEELVIATGQSERVVRQAQTASWRSDNVMSINSPIMSPSGRQLQMEETIANSGEMIEHPHDRIIEDIDRRAVVQQLLERLTPEERRAVELTHGLSAEHPHPMSARLVAEQMHIKRSQVQLILRRAYRAMQSAGAELLVGDTSE